MRALAYNAFMPRPTFLFPLSLALMLQPGLVPGARAQQAPVQTPPAVVTPAPPAQSDLPGVRNFTRVDATIACGGALASGAVDAVKQAGFTSIVNLRAADEEGANVQAEMAAAKKAGLTYIWLPFVTASPDAGQIDEFLKAVVDPANQPMLIHCTSGGRVSMFWAIKRVMVDGWPTEKAMAELPGLSKNVSPKLRDFALDYLKQHGK